MHPRNIELIDKLYYVFSFADSPTLYYLPGSDMTETILFTLAEQNQPVSVYSGLSGLDVSYFYDNETIG